MDETELILLFGLGIVAQAVVFLKEKIRESGGKIFWCLVIAFFLGGELVGKSYPGELFSNFTFAYFVSFCGVFGIFFRKKILPEISEKNVLSITIIFWYLLGPSLIHPVSPWQLLLIYFGVIPTLGTLYLAFTKNRLGRYTKVFFYAWFIITVVFTTWSYFSYESLSLFSEQGSKLPNAIDAFLTGMVLMYMVAYIAPVLDLVTEKNYQARMESVNALAEKYSDKQLKVTTSIAIIIVQGGSLAVNYSLHLLPDTFLISLWILVVPQISGFITELKKAKILI